MILGDTSVWIDHFHSEVREMREHLTHGRILIHPLIVAELALGNLRDRANTVAFLDLLPRARVAQITEVRQLIEVRNLYGRGIGMVDAELIASVLITPSTLLWTRDKQLRKVAEELRIAANLP